MKKPFEDEFFNFLALQFDINRITVVSDRDFNGNKIYMPISFVEHFSNDFYLIHIHQYSLTENAYKFWDALYGQSSNVGSIFDPQPARIKGNLFYIDDTEAPVHGFFGASAHQLGYQYTLLSYHPCGQDGRFPL